MFLLFVVLPLAGCDSAPAEEDVPDEGTVIEGVNIDVLFAPPSQAEVAAMRTEWANRQALAQTVADYQEVTATSISLAGIAATCRVVSHTVDGVLHYGAIVEPDNAQAGSLPVVVLLHGGDNGVNVDEMLGIISNELAEVADDFVFVVPSFRAEHLEAHGVTYQSQGSPSPWDFDVDDALALLTATLENIPAADEEQIGVVGFSRGADVALLMGIRDERIDLVVEFFGPTDFYSDFVRFVVSQALLGLELPLPGVKHINRTYIQPLKRGELTIDDVRPEILRRSPVYFTDELQRFQLQVHHGTKDVVVPVAEGQRLIEVMEGLGSTAPDFESYIYEDGTHDPFSLPGSLDRTAAFLSRLLPAAQPAF